ncbi:3-methyl-2-oxobutanoate hydroxymethyltransferase [Pontibacillus litoralis]|uniref:3-methyl-2-oxobutanoate hydroxymethyltransferase n=1 Tax=Pontibacillus litoralis JSM 072002 TaxID=1385512 RepID=A0A0A5HWE1_9BACI|nr:3-methyl-2-oxobutanoate hydroxymethyltransferase [Pontibacillus litoralis]KGX87942.1 3-methyl-2-oxobutanoate hydroxymethyltransferase [Pontibacillus litoralis JSM 072002]
MKTSTSLKEMKQRHEAITMITAYDYPSAKQAENAGVDMILVGDSLGMVVLGYDSTVPVTVDDMIHHGKAVVRGAKQTFVVIDMPFMSYHISPEETMKQAKRMIQETGAQAIKVEGAKEVITTIGKLTNAGIPVVAHLGLTPQSVQVLGGYRVQGKDKEAAQQLIDEALAVQASGAISLVLECVPAPLAKLIASRLDIPVIGIGAGEHCDGQVLVYHDVLQYGVERVPKFAKIYTNMNDVVHSALQQFVAEVKTKQFPTPSHSFTMKEEVISELYGGNTNDENY